MTRQHTALSQRFAHALDSPAKKQRTYTSATRAFPFHKSPLKLAVATGRKAVNGARRTSRFMKDVIALPTIEEENEEDGEQTYMNTLRNGMDASRSRRTLDKHLKALDADEDDEMTEWDEETTLVALLQDDLTSEDDQEDLVALVDKLKAPMDAKSQELRRYMAETTLPVVRRVKEVHETLEDEVDLAYGTGLLAFDEVCKRVEGLALHTEDETRTGYNQSQKEVRTMMAQLTEAYRYRDELWTELEENLEKCATRARTAIESIPQAVEDAIARLEKKNKDMDKNSNSQFTKHKMLKDLLGRL